MASRRNSLLKLNRNNHGSKITDSPKLFENDDLDDVVFNGEQNINNPFSSGQTISSITSKWSFNEQWRKFQQIIDSKDKQTNQNAKKEISGQELLNFGKDELINDVSDYSIHEGEEIQEGDINYIDYSELSEELTKNINIVNVGSLPNNLTNNLIGSTQQSCTIMNSTNLINDSTSSDSIPCTSITTPLVSSSTSTSIVQPTTAAVNNMINKDNKRDDSKAHTFLFSKIKKNCSIEQLDEVDDKENELFEKRREDSTVRWMNEISNNLSSSSTITSINIKSKSQQRCTAPSCKTLPTKQSPSNRKKAFEIKKRHSVNQFKDLSEESSVDELNATNSPDTMNPFNDNRQESRTRNVDEPIPSLPYFTSFIVNLFRERLNFFSFTTSFCTFFILIFAIQLSTLSSFANGFLIGIIFSILFLFIILIYALNYVFQKIDYENDLHQRILNGQRWQKFPAYKKLVDENRKSTMSSTQQTGVHEGWFFELVYSKKLGVDRLSSAEKCDYEKMPDTKLRLCYIKLEGTIMRVYGQKADQLKKINIDKVNFLKVSNKMTQANYDFSKMQTKKVQLWLPKNIINKKKYLWSRKFPFILNIEETNKMSEKMRTPFNLILFCRTNRDKEEWYNMFRQSIEIADQNLSIHHLSTTASTPDEVTHEQDNIPRAKSLDISNISYEFEHLSHFLNYETFIQDMISHNLHSSTSNASSNGKSSASNNLQNNDLHQNNNLLWFNALVGRVFFDFLTHPHWTRWVQLKIQRKLTRIKLPYFIQTIALKDVNLGTSLPKFLSVINNPVIDEKGIWIDFNLDYQGCFSMTLETKLDLMKLKEASKSERELKPIKPQISNQNSSMFEYDDLSDPESIVSLSDEDSEEALSIENDARQAKIIKLLDKVTTNRYFQQATDTKFLKKKMEEVSNLPIILTVNICKLKGVLTLNLPSAPSDRIWYGFRSLSEFELVSKPSFGERSIQLSGITQIISKKLKQEFYKLLVLPNLDDIVLGNVMMGHEDINILEGEVL